MEKDQKINDIITEHYRKMGKKGGPSRAKKLSPERRKEIAMMGVKARLKKKEIEITSSPS